MDNSPSDSIYIIYIVFYYEKNNNVYHTHTCARPPTSYWSHCNFLIYHLGFIPYTYTEMWFQGIGLAWFQAPLNMCHAKKIPCFWSFDDFASNDMHYLLRPRENYKIIDESGKRKSVSWELLSLIFEKRLKNEFDLVTS